MPLFLLPERLLKRCCFLYVFASKRRDGGAQGGEQQRVGLGGRAAERLFFCSGDFCYISWRGSINIDMRTGRWRDDGGK